MIKSEPSIGIGTISISDRSSTARVFFVQKTIRLKSGDKVTLFFPCPSCSRLIARLRVFTSPAGSSVYVSVTEVFLGKLNFFTILKIRERFSGLDGLVLLIRLS